MPTDEPDGLSEVAGLFPPPEHEIERYEIGGGSQVVWALPREFQHTVVGEIVWRASTVLSEWLALEGCPVGIRDRDVVELGAGCGLVGVVCATALGARSVTLTDYDEGVMRLLSRNAQENANAASRCRLEVAKVDWLSPFPDDLRHCCDVAVAADVVYCRALCDGFFRCASWIVRPGGWLAMANGVCRFSQNSDLCDVFSVKHGFDLVLQTVTPDSQVLSVYRKS